MFKYEIQMEVYFGHLNDQIYISYKSQYCSCIFNLGFHSGSVIKNPPASAGDVGSITGSGRSPGERNGNPLQYSGRGNSMERGAWWATVHEVVKELDPKATKQQQYLI